MIYLVRHGEITGAGEKRYIGQKDLPLSEKGRRQAHWWQRELAEIPFEKALCSDLERCQETARIIAGRRPIDINITTQLRELHLGQWEGWLMADVKKCVPALWSERGNHLDSFRPPGGESFSDLRNRVIPVIEAMSKDRDSQILMVAHAGVNRVILCHILDMPLTRLFRIGQDYGALNIIDYQEERPRVVAMNIIPREIKV